MGFLSGLKKLKLKKLKPGKLLVSVAKKIGGPIGGIASAAEKAAASFNKIKQQAKDLGLSPSQQAEKLANDAAAGMEAYAEAGGPAATDNAKSMLVVVGAVLLFVLLMRK